MKNVVVTGAAGQLAFYLIRKLESLGATVVGLVASDAQARGAAWVKRPVVADVTDYGSVARAFAKAGDADAIFHLASPTFVPDSWEQPASTLQGVTLGTLNVLDAARLLAPRSRVVCASSAEVFSLTRESPQRLSTPLTPNSPYGIAKAAAFQFTQTYRERHGLATCSLVLYPFESPRRAPNFVVPKICRAAARIGAGQPERLSLGALTAQRDWSWAEDVADAFVAAARSDQPHDALIGTGALHTVRDVVEAAFARVNLRWTDHVDVDESLVRPNEAVALTPDVEETECAIGYRASTTFLQMIDRLVSSYTEEHRRDPSGTPG